jgi:diazepam-binding inhibitor (GABA receptor modulating acyl-CoA-binding protein)
MLADVSDTDPALAARARQCAENNKHKKEGKMSDLQTRFESAARDVQQLPSRPDNDALLRLYALYKQATAGDASGNRPGLTDFVGRAKYDAWAKLKGMAREAAMQAYIELAESLR